MTRNRRRGLLYNRLDSSCKSIEHEFGLASLLAKRLSAKHTWKLLMLGICAKYHLFACFFIVNCYTCLCSNKISLRYKVDPPTLFNYLNTCQQQYYDREDADQFIMTVLAEEFYG